MNDNILYTCLFHPIFIIHHYLKTDMLQARCFENRHGNVHVSTNEDHFTFEKLVITYNIKLIKGKNSKQQSRWQSHI